MTSVAIVIKQHEQYYLIVVLIGLKAATLLKRRLWYECFPVNFQKFLGTSFLYRTHLGNCFWIELCKSLKEICTGTSLLKFLQSCHFNIK